MSDIETALAAAAEENPSAFRDSINAALMGKLNDAIDAKKIEVASSYLRPEETVTEVEPSEVVDDSAN